MTPDWQGFISPRGLHVPGRLQIVYQENGGPLRPTRDELPRHYRVVDPRTGKIVTTGTWKPGQHIEDDGHGPRFVIFIDSSGAR